MDDIKNLGPEATIIRPDRGTLQRRFGDLYNKTRLSPRAAAIMKKVIAWQS